MNYEYELNTEGPDVSRRAYRRAVDKIVSSVLSKPTLFNCQLSG